jgi:hypothetical protein
LLLPTVSPLWNFFHTSFTNCGSNQFPPPLHLFVYLFAVGLFLLVGPFLWRAGGGRRKDFEDEKCGATPFCGLDLIWNFVFVIWWLTFWSNRRDGISDHDKINFYNKQVWIAS